MSFIAKSIVWPIVMISLLAACAPAVTPAALVSTTILATPSAAPATAVPTDAATAASTAAAAAVHTPTPTAAPSAAISENTVAIADVTVVDVENGIAVPGQTVVVVGDRIDQIGAQGGIEIPQGAETIDGHGLYLMPGLVDAHVHYLEAPIFGRLMIANGILLVRDMGMPNEYILELRDELNRGETLGPEMVATGLILDGNPPLIPSISLGVTTPEEARQAVQKQAAAGADMIKVYSSLGKDAFLAILDEAQKLGLKVVGHVPESIYIEGAAAAGLKSSEHWFGFEKVIAKILGRPIQLTYTGMGSGAGYLERLDEVDPKELQAVYERLRASGLSVVPTVVTFKSWPDVDSLELADLPHGEYISQSMFTLWKTQWAGQTASPDWLIQNWVQMLKGMHQAGIPLMVGTDLLVPGIVPGFAAHEEMVLWQEAGIPAPDVLRSATLVPAQFMGLGERLGSIREGKTASMVIVRANPLDDIRNAQWIEGVFLRGEYFSRQDLDRMLAEARDLAQNPTP